MNTTVLFIVVGVFFVVCAVVVLAAVVMAGQADDELERARARRDALNRAAGLEHDGTGTWKR